MMEETTDILSFFNKVSVIDYAQIISQIEAAKLELNIKISSTFNTTKVLSKTNTSFNLEALPSLDNYSNEPVICLASLHNEYYLFKSHLTSDNKGATELSIPSEIYLLQRRNDYRVNMPLKLIYNAHIYSIGGRSVNYEIELADISLGGCQIIASKSEVETLSGDELLISLKVDNFNFSRLVATTKYVKKSDTDESQIFIGAKFSETTAEIKEELQKLVMFLDRINRGKVE